MIAHTLARRSRKRSSPICEFFHGLRPVGHDTVSTTNVYNYMSDLTMDWHVLILCISVTVTASHISSQRTVPRTTEMMAWYDRHNIMSNKLSIRHDQSGVRGVFAEEDIFPYEGIAAIPPNMIIRPEYKTLEDMLEVSRMHLRKIFDSGD
jgi:hypothetical protein